MTLQKGAVHALLHAATKRSTWSCNDRVALLPPKILVLGQFETGDSGIAGPAVIPAEAGIQHRGTRDSWTPAFAGVTGLVPCARRSDLKLPYYQDSRKPDKLRRGALPCRSILLEQAWLIASP